MRLVIVGCESFIAQHLQRVATARGTETVALSFDADISTVIRSGDSVINLGLSPAFKNAEYDESIDSDLRVIRTAVDANAHALLLSTRRVYPEGSRWNASEDGASDGDETHYGRNKARTEAAIRALSNGRVAIVRMSNVFGYEYLPHAPRRSFLGQLLHSLKKTNTIRFDMHADTQRDFIPVENCVSGLLDALNAQAEGVYNLGAGFPVRCGEIAAWIQQGFGRGGLVCEPPVVRDEFFLNMTKWESRFGYRPVEHRELQAYCIQLGQRLKCEKS